MKINVKMLQGQECSMEVSAEISVAQLKDNLALEFNVPKNEQKLILMGKPLIDDKTLGQSGVKDGSKLNLIRSRTEAGSAAASSDMAGQPAGPLSQEVLKFLLKRLPSDSANKVHAEFMKDFNRSISTLSLDDLERIAKTRLQEEKAP